jgi:hypothetical protein
MLLFDLIYAPLSAGYLLCLLLWLDCLQIYFCIINYVTADWSNIWFMTDSHISKRVKQKCFCVDVDLVCQGILPVSTLLDVKGQRKFSLAKVCSFLKLFTTAFQSHKICTLQANPVLCYCSFFMNEDIISNFRIF